MESLILNTISHIRHGKKRPSKEEIFNWMRKREGISDEDFNGDFESLLSKGSIYNKIGKIHTIFSILQMIILAIMLIQVIL